MLRTRRRGRSLRTQHEETFGAALVDAAMRSMKVEGLVLTTEWDIEERVFAAAKKVLVWAGNKAMETNAAGLIEFADRATDDDLREILASSEDSEDPEA